MPTLVLFLWVELWLVFLGKEISEQRNYSEKIAERIDDTARREFAPKYILLYEQLEAEKKKVQELEKIIDDISEGRKDYE